VREVAPSEQRTEQISRRAPPGRQAGGTVVQPTPVPASNFYLQVDATCVALRSEARHKPRDRLIQDALCLQRVQPWARSVKQSAPRREGHLKQHSTLPTRTPAGKTPLERGRQALQLADRGPASSGARTSAPVR